MSLRHILAAFHARPLGMPIPPNWFGLAAFGLLGILVNPGFLALGAGLELGYLWLVSSNPRFRRLVDGGEQGADWGQRRSRLLLSLGDEERAQQQKLEQTCTELAHHFARTAGDLGSLQSDHLARLCWLHLRLLAARGSVATVVRASAADTTLLTRQRSKVEKRLETTGDDDSLRSSLQGQLDLITQRLATQQEAVRRLALIEAELERIRQQIALTREQALIATDAQGLSTSVEALASTIGEANRWINDSRTFIHDAGDLFEQPDHRVFLAKAESEP